MPEAGPGEIPGDPDTSRILLHTVGTPCPSVLEHLSVSTQSHTQLEHSDK